MESTSLSKSFFVMVRGFSGNKTSSETFLYVISLHFILNLRFVFGFVILRRMGIRH